MTRLVYTAWRFGVHSQDFNVYTKSPECIHHPCFVYAAGWAVVAAVRAAAERETAERGATCVNIMNPWMKCV